MESLSVAAKYYHYDWLIDSQGRYKAKVDWNAFQNLCLLEFEVRGEFSPSELEEITQGDQAPYLEAYLDTSGTRRLSEDEAIQTDGRRVCFFMHFLEIGLPIRVAGEAIEVKSIGELPDRLAGMIPYVPPD